MKSRTVPILRNESKAKEIQPASDSTNLYDMLSTQV
jgi:hypothetical protein